MRVYVDTSVTLRVLFREPDPLATAIHIRDTLGLDAFLTHDTQLAAAAAASGFTVQGI